MTNGATQRAKQRIRNQIWELLEAERAAPEGVAGHIPAFYGADEAAARLAQVPAWQAARIIKAVPDLAQQPVRARALRDGKTVYMAAPRLAAAKPFYLLDPETLMVPPEQAAAHRTAATVSQPVGPDEMRPVDLIVCGSVAVNRDGARLGKGAGYSDIEVALLAEAGLIGKHTLIATTVHPLQIVQTDIPETIHDFRVDLIITPDDTITCPPQQRPTGIIWEHLQAETVAAIPALQARHPKNQI
ncbi:5-formyltetrahydrofolate cyclo-ligase [Streptomyces sp. NPDC053474]|uniref:5-formyltetrahydrofolate cyclo-ligase n=1 Tax=Streptomyces sp. NPDC053474 TaxID=3365704 RepID=UPI0037D37F8D